MMATYHVCDHICVSHKLYRDAYILARPSTNLGARRFGSFKVVRLVGINAVRLRPPRYSKTHYIFHVCFTTTTLLKPTERLDKVPKRRS